MLPQVEKCEDTSDQGGWVLLASQAEIAELLDAKKRIQTVNRNAFGTETPGRLLLWSFSIRCRFGSTEALRHRAYIVAAYKAYFELLERVRSLALGRASDDFFVPGAPIADARSRVLL
ncbi:hypothetical protein [Burkholderia ambifaria]|uniref:hypothetical protein n=1 Tax=Burkholderia ambifaria TaxID=152480 RepID=UPI000F80BDF6|nr:hypothetical protein [Burkholderia ambifaria]